MTAAIEALRRVRATTPQSANPWHALWAMMVGFFMILVDATIVAVANPSIMDDLRTDYDAVIWVTSAYLLAYAVPLLLAGRLGDRYGPKNLYLVGLLVFTAASLWCGLAGTVEVLIAARVVQGVGAALLTPQTLSAITRLFPADRRGVALSIWGATAGVATLVGPLAGGLLVGGLGWHWIFIVNVPIGIAGLALAYWFVPSLPTEKRGFDVPGVVLSGLGMFLIVFALQEGQSHDWAPWIWGMVAAGVGAMAGFVYWQSVNPGEPLIPLRIFRDNDFSLSNLGISVIGFAVTAMILPLMFYAQAVAGLSPTRAALLTAPMAIASGGLAPVVGKLVDRFPPTPIVGFGFSALAIALTWLSVEMTDTTPIWRLVLPLALIGIGMAFIWSPLAATATRHLPPDLAGAGSGVYNTMRQVGGVLGSAGMAAFMTSRIAAEMPGGGARPPGAEGAITALPEQLQVPFSAALSQALLLPAFVSLLGVIAALFLRGYGREPAPTVPGSVRPIRRGDRRPRADHDYFRDDDDYVEYTVEWDDPVPAAPVVPPIPPPPADDTSTDRFVAHVDHPLPAPADEWRGGPVDSWEHLLEDEPSLVVGAGADAEVVDAVVDFAVADAATDVHPVVEPVAVEPIEPIAVEPVALTPVRQNGSVLDGLPNDGPPPADDRPWRSMLDLLLDKETPPAPSHNGFHVDDQPSGGRHSRGDGDAGTYGKHSMPFRE
ncbi:MFS transporter [Mycolicibacterium sediminis]|uniref:MFS transporter n=1 Tax=Mycolicibacterium sediminis TaxID=1286180 RepID=A0A7I7QY31_9MYCO|nr:MFS transporter [Mycolicibacterium sediminis]BBY31222.1 MFS transporter [Mycolicibacterium sediminis]